MDTNPAEAALLALARELTDEIAAGRAVELAIGRDSPRPPDWGMTRTQLLLAANSERATPVVKGAQRFCDFCGGVDDLEPGPDQRHGVGDAWMCRDERQCVARRDRRYPPDRSRVPDGLLDWAGQHDAAAAVRAAEDRASQAEAALARAQQERDQQPSYQPWVYSGASGAWDKSGQWHPPVPEPKTGAAAVHPHLGIPVVRLPGDTISGHAHAHVPRPRPQLGGSQLGGSQLGGPQLVPHGGQETQQPRAAGQVAQTPAAARPAADGFYQAARGISAPHPQQAGQIEAGVGPGDAADAAKHDVRPPAREQVRRDRYGNRRYPRRGLRWP
jgi:hypothetical protein